MNLLLIINNGESIKIKSQWMQLKHIILIIFK